jgi:hypothetical protein
MAQFDTTIGPDEAVALSALFADNDACGRRGMNDISEPKFHMVDVATGGKRPQPAVLPQRHSLAAAIRAAAPRAGMRELRAKNNTPTHIRGLMGLQLAA